jgi:hypothetical protein
MSDKPRAIYKNYTAYTFRQPTGCNTAYIICMEKDGKPFRVNISMGKGGGCARGVSSAIGDLVNAILECGGDLDKAVKALEDHDCHKRQCCSNEIAKCLKLWKGMYDADTKQD